jgi:hypothetical protein
MTVGRKCLFRPGSSDVDLLGYRKGVVNLDSEISHRAFDLGVAQKQLHRSQIPRSLVDQRCLGAPDRMGAVERRIKANACDPLRQKPCVLSGG